MRILAPIFTLATLVLPASAAHAGAFGGFSADEKTYLEGTDQICRPVPAGARLAAPSCDKAEPDTIAAGKFRKPAAQSGPRAAFRATARGNDLQVTSAAGDTIDWTSVDPITRVDGVYVSPNGTMVAVDIRIRMGGRVVEDVIAFRIADAAKTRAVVSAATTGKAVKRSAAADKAIAKGQKLLKKRRYKKAEAAFRAGLAEAAGDPEALYGLAASLIGRKKTAGALAEIEKLGKSTHPQAGVWRVEARHDRRFKKLLTDKTFRVAVRIDPGLPKTAFERLVGASGHWEQAGVTCDSPRLNLKLKRRPQTFKLTLRATCQGYTDTTRLSGSWAAEGNDRASLTFPNPGGKAETLACQIATCSDGSGEDCMVCGAGTDLEMKLRLVRR
jgi:hypothetical protein